MTRRLLLIGLTGVTMAAGGEAPTKARRAVESARTVRPMPTQRIDLATALRLAGAANLDIQIARERVAEAEANELAAVEQFFPAFSPGAAYRRHEGNIQAVEGRILDAEKEQYTAGVTAEGQVQVGEAIFRTLAARQIRDAAKYAAGAQEQGSVLEAALGYFELARTAAVTDVAGESVHIAEDYAGQIKQAAEAGLAFRGDVSRATTQTERNRLSLAQAQQQERLAASHLSQVLHMDSTMALIPAGGELVPLRVAGTEASLDTLVMESLSSRPELKQYAAQLAAAKRNRQGALYGPLIPTVNGQAFYGGLGGGIGNPGPQDFDQSSDYGAGVSWRIGPGGLFDFGRVRANDARVRVGELELEKTRDEVIRQVVDGYTRVHSLGSQLGTARRALAAAEETLKLARERREFGVGVVLEAIQSEQDLTRARTDYVSIVAEHNKAVYLLERARGALQVGVEGKAKSLR